MADIDGIKHALGRPTKYQPKYCEEIIAFFDVEPNREVPVVTTHKNGETSVRDELRANSLPTMERFAHTIGVNCDTLVEWSKRHPAFSAAYTRAKQLQKDILIDNGLMGLYNGPFAIFVAKNATDMHDRSEVEHSGGLKLGKYSHAELEALAAGTAGARKSGAGPKT